MNQVKMYSLELKERHVVGYDEPWKLRRAVGHAEPEVVQESPYRLGCTTEVLLTWVHEFLRTRGEHIIGISMGTIPYRIAIFTELIVEEVSKPKNVMIPTKVYEHALRVMEGDKRATDQWFETPRAALVGKTPLETLGTEEGVQAVENLLDAIEDGLFS